MRDKRIMTTFGKPSGDEGNPRPPKPMAERKPLPGWAEDGDDCGFIRGGIELLASKTRWMLIFKERSQSFFGHHLPPTAAQLAAEDAARAMVAEMAEALGGSVIWGVDQPQPLPPHLYIEDNDGNS